MTGNAAVLTTTIPGVVYALLLGLASQAEAPRAADAFQLPAEPPAIGGERQARAPSRPRGDVGRFG